MIHGTNPILLNVVYKKPEKNVKECFEVVYMTQDGSVHYSEEPPEVDIYFTKEKYRNYNYNKPQEALAKLDKRRVIFSKIKYEIAKEIGQEGLDFIKYCYDNKASNELNRLYGWRFCYLCDFQPEFYYMKEWYSKYKLETPKLTKAFLDIEIDMIDFRPDLSNLTSDTYAPVNCATIIFEETKECFTFILEPYKPNKIFNNEENQRRLEAYENQLKQHEALMNDLNGFKKELQESFDKTYGFINYTIQSFESEMKLIYTIFKVINDRKPNYCLAWNMRFDIQYLIERIKILGYDPRTVICHPDFKNPICYFKIDNRTYEIKGQTDYFYCSSYTQYICQMRTYAAIRKSQHMLKSVKLNAISDAELGDKKIDYSEEGDIVSFPYRNWRKFIKYNIKDVLLQVGVERKNDDVLTYYMRAHMNCTPYNKMFKETHLLRNVREIYFEKDGWVQGNNLNILKQTSLNEFEPEETNDDDSDDEASYKGAINADPVYNDNVGVNLTGISKSNTVFKNCIDMDFAAFYPSIKISNNIDPSTLLYKASFDNDEFISGEFSNKSLNTSYTEKDKNGKERKLDITGEAVNTLVGNNALTFAYNYLSLPNVNELYEFIKKNI